MLCLVVINRNQYLDQHFTFIYRSKFWEKYVSKFRPKTIAEPKCHSKIKIPSESDTDADTETETENFRVLVLVPSLTMSRFTFIQRQSNKI